MQGEPAERTHRFNLLLIALVALIVAHAFLFEAGAPPRLLGLIFAAVLVVAIWVASGERRVLALALALGLPPLLLRLLHLSMPGERLLLVGNALTAVFLAFTIWVLLGALLSSGRITTDRIYGAICIYLLIGLLWSFLFAILEIVEPGSFRFPPGDPRNEAHVLARGSQESFVFFSYTTLSTLGYGDITPLTPKTRTLAWIEAVVGQLFLAVMIARLVGLHIVASDRDS